MTSEEVEKWQEFILDTAKKILLEQNRVHTQVFILTQKMNIPEKYKKRLLDLDTYQWAAQLDDGSRPKDYVMMMLPVFYEDPEQLLSMIADISVDPSAMRAALPSIVAKGKEIGATNPERSIVEVFKRMHGFGHDKDIVATFLNDLVNDVEAEAWAKVDEAWTREIAPDEGETPEQVRSRVPNTLEHDKLATEVLMVSIETKSQTRLVTLPFYRTERDVGKVTDFGKPRVLIDDGSGPERLSGRFVGFIREVRNE